MTDFIICLGITGLTVLVFTLGYYCTANGRKENSLVSKLNIVERSLLASNKETAILKNELTETLNKLASIEDNSFGSNDMVIALKKELDENELEKEKLREQVVSLEKVTPRTISVYETISLYTKNTHVFRFWTGIGKCR